MNQPAGSLFLSPLPVACGVHCRLDYYRFFPWKKKSVVWEQLRTTNLLHGMTNCAIVYHRNASDNEVISVRCSFASELFVISTHWEVFSLFRVFCTQSERLSYLRRLKLRMIYRSKCSAALSTTATSIFVCDIFTAESDCFIVKR